MRKIDTKLRAIDTKYQEIEQNWSKMSDNNKKKVYKEVQSELIESHDSVNKNLEEYIFEYCNLKNNQSTMQKEISSNKLLLSKWFVK